MKYGPPIAAIVVLLVVASIPGPVSAGDGTNADEKTSAKPAAPPAEKPAETTEAEAAETPTEAPGAQPVAQAPAEPALVLPEPALLTTIQQVRLSAIGTEANAVAYLDLIVAGKASAAQVNDFAAYIAKRGMPRVALAFQEHALRLEQNDATLWLNLGTIRRTIGSYGPAVAAFKRAIEIDPAHAMAHYNLGSVYDAEKKYDEAIEEYRRALVLDPDLGDPRKNPQVVNNEYLLAVRLQIYQNQAGSLGLPLLQMQKNPPRPEAAHVKP